jgi:formiminotetrahydrofolate cyclodeaminase
VEGRAKEILVEAEQLRAELRSLVDEDALVYAGVSKAYKIPKDDPGRAAAVDAALLEAARTPAEVARVTARVLELAGEIGTIGNKNATSDANVAAGLAKAAVAGAMENVRANVAGMSDKTKGQGLLG